MKDYMKEATLKDLEIQWNDHFHMRDQTWKVLSNSILLFLGVIALELKGIADLVMIPSYSTVVFLSYYGWKVATHHRLRQGEKFAIIKKEEELLGIYELKRDILERRGVEAIYTAKFIEGMQVVIGLIGTILLLRRIMT